MSKGHLANLFQVFKQRMIDLYQSDPRLRYILVFKNYGPAAGGSIPHTHSQLIATPVIPENIQAEVESSARHFTSRCRCIFCTLIDEALTFEATIYNKDSGEIHRRIDVGQYVVEKGEHFVAIKPFASLFEWEIHILPLHHQADFCLASDEELADFASVLKNVMARLDTVLGGAQYNFYLHTLPHGDAYSNCQDSYHWHLEICPRTSIPTGFELGSGFFINSVSPDGATRRTVR